MRQLDTATLESAARDYAGLFLQPERMSRSGKVYLSGPGKVMQDFARADFKDEFEFLVNGDAGIKAYLGPAALRDFEKRAAESFKPRSDKVFAETLKRKLAIDPKGNHIPGVRGTTQIGSRIVGSKVKIRKTRHFGEVMIPKLVTWPVYAGEIEERRLGNSKVIDALPEGAEPWPLEVLLATNPNISAEAAIAALDAIVDSLDEGSTAATIRIRTGTQPADPDAAESGTLLSTNVMSDPAFAGAVDDTDGSVSATADTIADDAAADATGTAGYFRMGATGTGADDHIDGSVGTSAADMILNTLSFVSGAVISISSFVVGLSQGATAS